MARRDVKATVWDAALVVPPNPCLPAVATECAPIRAKCIQLN